jgi:hypothetical protein
LLEPGHGCPAKSAPQLALRSEHLGKAPAGIERHVHVAISMSVSAPE